MYGMVSYLDLDDGIHKGIVNDREGLRGIDDTWFRVGDPNLHLGRGFPGGLCHCKRPSHLYISAWT